MSFFVDWDEASGITHGTHGTVIDLGGGKYEANLNTPKDRHLGIFSDWCFAMVEVEEALHKEVGVGE